MKGLTLNSTKIYLTFSLFMFVLLNSNLLSQSINSHEARYISLSQLKAREMAVLDSLRNIFTSRAKEIDEKKKASVYDEDAVRKLMASSVILSIKIEEGQNNLTRTEEELRKTRVLLDQEYSSLIDSLQKVVRLNVGADKETSQNQILAITEKKLLVAPQIISLSFDPEKILSLNPSAARKEIEKKMYGEYLNGALDEVDGKLKQTRNTKKEVKQILSLQKKSKKFLEEVEFNSEVSRTTLSMNNPAGTTNAGFADNKTFGAGYNLVPQFQTYAYILKQLETKSLSGLKTPNYSSLINSNKKLELKEYADLLDDVEKRLDDYRSVLINKIKNAE